MHMSRTATPMLFVKTKPRIRTGCLNGLLMWSLLNAPVAAAAPVVATVAAVALVVVIAAAAAAADSVPAG